MKLTGRHVEGANSGAPLQQHWLHHRIGESDPVVDVSAANDWTAVRVWWAPVGQIGNTTYSTYGFITP